MKNRHLVDVRWGLAFLGFAASACGSDASPNETATQPGTAVAGRDAIVALVGTPGNWKRLAILPAAAPTEGGQVGNSPLSTSLGTRSLAPMSAVETPSGSTAVDFVTDGWLLVRAAAVQCGMLGTSAVVEDIHPEIRKRSPYTPEPNSVWYVIPEWAEPSCDGLLAFQEFGLCVADKLAEIAEAPGAVVWERLAAGAPLVGDESLPWTFPPQSPEVRYIARDLAIDALARVAELDTRRADGSSTCTAIYSMAAVDGAWGASNQSRIFYTQYGASIPAYFLPQLPIVDGSDAPLSSNVEAMAAARLDFKAHILRASARLLNELVNDGVKADLAGAASARARARDAVSANKTGWGLTPEGAYNSYAHAARVVAGRWKIESPDAPAGVAPLELLPRAYGPDIDARTDDVEVTSEQMRLAMTLVRQSGIVYKPNGSTKAIVKRQLEEAAATKFGLSSSDSAFQQQKAFIDGLVDSVSDQHLEAAAGRVWREYRMFSNTDASAIGPSEPSAHGLEAAAYQDPLLTAGHGWAFQGGLPTCQTSRDPVATAGGLLEASQTTAPEIGFEGLLSDNSSDTAFQDAYSLAQTLRQRLIAVRDEAPDASEANRTAKLGAAEVGGWAGQGRVSVIPHGERITSLDLYLIGLSSDELFGTAAQPPRQVARDAIRLVYGFPWEAECAAGVRTACPASMSSAIATAHTDSDLTAEPDWPLLRADGVGLKLTFSANEQGRIFAPQYSSAAPGQSGRRLYVVQRRDPRAPMSQGRVLAALALREDGKATTSVVSRHQRKQLGSLVAVSDRDCHKFDVVGGGNWGKPQESCVPGIANNAPIPLENELTNNSDSGENSYLHYLAIAERDAAHADELGRQLIEYGIQQDERRENAQRKLGEECGDYAGVLEATTVNADGELTTTDPTLSECFDSEKTDVVLLGRMPKDLVAAKDKGIAQALEYIRRAYLDCDGAGASNEYCGKDFTYDALELDSMDSSDEPDPPRCDDALSAIRSLSTQFTGFADLAAQDYATRSAMRNASLGLRLEVAKDFSWTLSGLGGKMMDSKAADYWPGCVLSGEKLASACGPNALAMNDLYRQNASQPGLNGDTWLAKLGDGAGEFGDPLVASRVLLWRLQGSLAVLAALGGSAPSSLVTTPVPAAMLGGESAAPIMTVFNRGEWFKDSDPDKNEYHLKAQDLDELTGTPLSTDSSELWPDLHQIPAWIRSIYTSQNASGYLNVLASSESIDFPEVADGNYAWLQARSKELEGIVCSDGLEGGTSDLGVVEVGRMKRGALGDDPYGTWGNVCFWELPSLVCDYPNDGCNGSGTFGLKARPWISASGQVDLQLDFRNYDAFWWEENHGCKSGGIGSYDEVRDAMLNHCQYVANNANTLGLMHEQEVPLGVVGDPLQLRLLPPDGTEAHESSGDDGYRIRRRSVELLAAHKCTPGLRARLMVNFYPPYKACAAASEVTQALGLACYLRRGGITVQKPPALNSESAIHSLVLWLEQQAITIKQQVGRLHIEKVPTRVVKDFHSRKSGSGSLKGKQAEYVLEMEKGLNDIVRGLDDTAALLQTVSGAIDGARAQLTIANLTQRETAIKLALTRLEFEHTLAIDAANAAGGIVSALAEGGNPGAAVSAIGKGAADAYFGWEKKKLQDDLIRLQAQQDALTVEQTMSALSQQVAPTYSAIQSTISRLAEGVAAVSLSGHRLQEGEDAAKYEAALGSGADYVKMSDGQYAKFPVNTALRRQYDVTRLRYLDALGRAKYSAYVARLAIEQRIGARLTDFKEPIGPLDAPAQWADDICDVTGIDYEKLVEIDLPSAASGTGGAAGSAGAGGNSGSDGSFQPHFWGNIDILASAMAEAGLTRTLADQYVGDYVRKLQVFVDAYNIEFPSKEGDDTVVLSLREDLLSPREACWTEARNLLFHSDRLDAVTMVADPQTQQSLPRGWKMHRCSTADDKCLEAVSGSLLDAKLGATAGPPSGGASYSWVYDRADLSGLPNAGTGPDTPERLVYQTVDIVESGEHILSWYDQARAANGQPLQETSGHPPYSVTIYDEAWTPISASTFAPSGAEWSTLRTTTPFVTVAGSRIHVAFAPSLPGPSLGSLLIANVQLERGAARSVYQATGATRLVPSGNCNIPDSGSMRSRFTHRCSSAEGCYYELDEHLGLGSMSAVGGNSSFAAGNYNYRHVSVAVNLVGTGLMDCNGLSSGCYGSSYLEYSLDHDASWVTITGWDAQDRQFNFLHGSVNQGKALAAERVLTVPLSSADLSLVSQFEKGELRGRPLDGTYRFRIHDRPGFVWERLEDVQIVLKYHYWSPVRKSY